MGSEGVITITKEQLLAKKAEKNETPRLKEAEKLAQEAHHYFLAKINSAKNDQDYIYGITGLRSYGKYELIRWMFNDLENDETITLNDLIADLEGHFSKRIESQVNALRILRERLESLKITDDKSIAIVIKNGEVGPNTEHGYYILASLSKYQATIFDKDLTFKTNPNRPLVFLFTNNVACVSHACSMAHKTSSHLGDGILALNPSTRIELQNNIKMDGNGIAQFVIGRDEDGNNITQDLESYILCSVALGIDDRVVRLPVPKNYQ